MGKKAKNLQKKLKKKMYKGEGDMERYSSKQYSHQNGDPTFFDFLGLTLTIDLDSYSHQTFELDSC